MTPVSWRSMDDAPRDGSVFLHLSGGRYGIVGKPPRPIEVDLHLGLYRRAGVHGGYWTHSSRAGESHSSTGDRQLSYGHWIAPDDFDALIERSPLWPTMPATDPVILFRRDSDHELLRSYYSAAAAWRALGGVVSSRGPERPLAPGYLDGNGVNGMTLPMRWAPPDDFLPPGFRR